MELRVLSDLTDLAVVAYDDPSGAVANRLPEGWQYVGPADASSAVGLPMPATYVDSSGATRSYFDNHGYFTTEDGSGKAFVAINHSTHEISVVFRGTDGWLAGDLSSNITIAIGNIATTASKFEVLVQAVKTLLSELETTGSWKLLAAGHSLGGALAEWFVGNEPSFDGGVGIGSPSTINTSETPTLNSNFVHVTHLSDTVGMFDPFGGNLVGGNVLGGLNHIGPLLRIYDDDLGPEPTFDLEIIAPAHHQGLYKSQISIIENSSASEGYNGTGSVRFLSSQTDNSIFLSQISEHSMILGGARADLLDASGAVATVRLDGRFGNDTVQGGAGSDYLEGSVGDDALVGGLGDDRLSGGTGNDRLDGGFGSDTFVGGTGDDIYNIGPNQGVDVLDDQGDGASDTIIYYGSGLVTAATQFHYALGASPMDMVVAVKDANGATISEFTIADMGVLTGQIEFLHLVDSDPAVLIADPIDLRTEWLKLDAPQPPTPGDGDDFGGNTTTNGILAIGGSVQGSIGTPLDKDWFAVSLVAGETYEFSLSGADGGGGTLADPFMRVRDPFGQSLVFNEDADAGTRDARIVFTAPTTGTYFVSVGGDLLTGGTYLLQSTPARPEATEGDDSLSGGAGLDSIDGLGGNDTLLGGNGSDTLIGGSGNDSLDGGEGNDSLQGGTGRDTIYGGNGNDIIGFGNSLGLSNQFFRGFADGGLGDDLIYAGLDLNNILGGGDGNDTITTSGTGTGGYFSGHSGNDLLIGTGGSAYALYENTLGPITVDLTITGSQYVGFGEDYDTLIDMHVVGGAFADTITGNALANRIFGGPGGDRMSGGDGNDMLVGGGVFDTTDLHADTLAGQGGDDQLYASPGGDRLDGGAGFDVAYFNLYPGAVSVDLAQAGAPQAVGGSFGSVTLIAVEGLSGSSGADTLRGDDSANTLDGYEGDDLLDGNGGADTLIDHFGNDTLLGGAGSDFIYGGAGADSLNGGGDIGSHDTLIGGAGMDALLIDFSWASGSVSTSAGWLSSPYYTGAAQVFSVAGNSASVTVSTIEALVIATGSGSDNLALSGGSNTVFANAGADTVVGGDGNDRISLGSGNDIGNGGAGDDSLIGGIGDDQLRGESGNDTLLGEAGIDVLNGGAGNDVLNGGDNYDFALYFGATAGVFVRLSEVGPQDTGGAGIDTLISIEAVSGSQFGDTLVGTDNSDQFYGEAGNDSLVGHGGNDVFRGDAGNDTADGGAGVDQISYQYDAAAVRVDLATAGPQDTGGSGIDQLIGIEQVVGSAFNDTLSGDGAANFLSGFNGDDSISGRAGNDTLFLGEGNDTGTGGDGDDYFDGGIGNDFMDGGTGNDTQIAGAGFDTAVGGAGNDLLDGGADADSLSGADGNDTLRGGSGDDLLAGGRGADVFIFGAGFGNDTIIDFRRVEDEIRFEGAGFADFADMMAHALQVGRHVMITNAAGDSLQLNNTLLSSLQSADFLFS